MTKYIVSHVSISQLHSAGIKLGGTTSRVAYLIENGILLSATDYGALDVLQWIEDGAVYIRDDLSKLPPALHYATTDELMRNKSHVKWGDLTEGEQETFDKEIKKDYTKCIYGEENQYALFVKGSRSAVVVHPCSCPRDEYVYCAVKVTDII